MPDLWSNFHGPSLTPLFSFWCLLFEHLVASSGSVPQFYPLTPRSTLIFAYGHLGTESFLYTSGLPISPFARPRQKVKLNAYNNKICYTGLC